MRYTVADLRVDIKDLPDDEEIVILIEQNSGDDDDDEIRLEDGDILDIQEAGGYVRGMRIIRARPR